MIVVGEQTPGEVRVTDSRFCLFLIVPTAHVRAQCTPRDIMT